MPEHVLDDLDLVRHLRPPEHRHERAVGRFERVTEVLQLLFHQQPCGAAPHLLDNPLHRRVRPVRGSERVIHVEVRQRRQLRRERRIVLLLLGVEPQVLQQHDLLVCVRLRHGRARRFADAVGGEDHRAPDQLRQARDHWRKAVLGHRLAFRATEVRGENDRGALFEGVPDRRQRCADAGVVANHAVLDGYVEVDADEDTLAGQIEIFDGEFHHTGSRLQAPGSWLPAVRPCRARAARGGTGRTGWRRLRNPARNGRPEAVTPPVAWSPGADGHLQSANLQPLADHVAQQVDAAHRVAPFVVVPGQHLDERAVHHRRVRRVDDRGVGVAPEID